MKTIVCGYCGKEARFKYSNTVFCSKRCRSKSYKERSGLSTSGRSTGVTGAIGELRVCGDLLSKGFEVFRAVSQACSCDLAILKAGKLRRVEVRTAQINKVTGHILKNLPKPDRYDVLAFVLPDTIIYDPEP